MDGLTPASVEDLPQLGDLVADEPFWRYRAGGRGREDVAHLRVWLTTGPAPGHLAVVTETGPGACVTESARHIRAGLARRYGPAVVLLEHHLAPELAEGAQTLDLVRFGAEGSPHWSRIWPTQQEHPRHADLELWMAAHGYQIVSRPGAMVRLWPGRGELTVRSCLHLTPAPASPGSAWPDHATCAHVVRLTAAWADTSLMPNSPASCRYVRPSARRARSFRTFSAVSLARGLPSPMAPS